MATVRTDVPRSALRGLVGGLSRTMGPKLAQSFAPGHRQLLFGEMDTGLEEGLEGSKLVFELE